MEQGDHKAPYDQPQHEAERSIAHVVEFAQADFASVDHGLFIAEIALRVIPKRFGPVATATGYVAGFSAALWFDCFVTCRRRSESFDSDSDSCGFGGVASIRRSTSSVVSFMPAKKTRFIVLKQGLAYELFNIKENPKGEISIITKTGTRGGNSTRGVSSSRTNIHRTPGSHDGRFTIKRTTIWSDEKYEEQFLDVIPNGNCHSVLVGGTLVQRFNERDAIDETNYSKDEFIHVYDNYFAGSIVYFLVVSKDGLLDCYLDNLGFFVIRRKMKVYTLYFLFAILGTKAIPGSFLAFSQSKSPRINGELEVWLFPQGSPREPLAMCPHHFRYEIAVMLNFIVGGAISRWHELHYEDGEKLTDAEIAEAKEYYNFYYDSPDQTRPVNRLLELVHQLANPPSGLYIRPAGPEGEIRMIPPVHKGDRGLPKQGS